MSGVGLVVWVVVFLVMDGLVMLMGYGMNLYCFDFVVL